MSCVNGGVAFVSMLAAVSNGVENKYSVMKKPRRPWSLGVSGYWQGSWHSRSFHEDDPPLLG